MATATTNVALNVTGNAQQQLAKTQKSVDNLQKSFGSLRNIVGGIAIGSLLTNIVRTADAMDDLSKATGLSIATVTGLGDAIKDSGGEVQDAIGVLGRFSQSLEEGRQGTLKAEYQFSQLGISIAELRNLSDEDVLRKTIEALAKMPAGAERTALAMELLGKQARFLDFNNLNATLDQFINNAKKAEPGTKALADLMGNLEGIGRSFSQQLIANGTGFAETLVKLTQNTDQIAKSLVELTRIITILGAAFTIFGKVLPGIKNVRDGIASITKITAFARLGKDIANITNNFKRFLGILPSAYSGIQSLGFSLANVGVLLTRLTGYGLVVYGLGEAFKALTGTINPVTKALEFLRDIGVVVLAQLKREWDSLVESFKAWTELLGLSQAFEFLAQSIVGIFSGPLDWLENRLQGIAGWWKETVREAEKTLGIAEDMSKPLVIQGEGAQAMPKDYFAKGREARAKAAKEQQTELQLLKQGIDNTTQAFIRQKEATLASLRMGASFVTMSERQRDIVTAQTNVYDDFTNKIEEYKNKISELPPEQKILADEYLKQIGILENLRTQHMLQAIEAVNATHDQIDATNELNRALDLEMQKRANIESIKNVADEIRMLIMTTEERKKFLRTKEAEKTFNDEINAINDEIARKNKNATEADILGWKRRRLEATNFYNELLLKNEELDAAENNSANKLEQHLKQREEDLKASLDPAARLIDLTKRFDQEIDNFVETGKFRFKDMIGSWVKDWLAAEAKLAATQLFKQIFSGAMGAIGGGVAGFIGKIFGFANGGNPPVNKPSIVGEKGPELFVPKQAGTIIPNNQLGKNGMATGAVNAPVTNNYNTYNINALDAKSVAQLFAENRKTLLGVTETARRELAYGT